MNILILSAGTRNKIVQFFKKELEGKGKVVATDCSELAPALYDADKHYIVPRIDDPNYIDAILDICKKENIKGLFSLIDPELSLLAENKNKFLKEGIVPIVSDYDTVEMSLNKMKMHDFCIANGINTIKSYDNLADFKKALGNREIDFPVFVKPICGSCSNQIQKVEDMEELEFIFKRYDGLMIQELMTGYEIGADVYIDLLSKEIVSIFTKKKLLMRAGETDKSVSFKDEKLFEFIENFVKKAGFIGQIDIDIYKKDGEYLISEVNPRFGGGYPHAYACGCDFTKHVVNNLKGIENKEEIGKYQEKIYMMKYLDMKIKEEIQ